jgi:hypothetical protein
MGAIDEIKALKKAFSSVKDRQKKNRPHDLNEKIARPKAIREASVGDDELIAFFVNNLLC